MNSITKCFAITLFITLSTEPVLAQLGESIPQGLSPSTMAITQDGKYGYIGFDLSEVVFKVRLADLTVVAGADLSRYFPIESEDIALDSSEEKLFVYSPTWRKLLVLDTKTMSVIHTIDSINVFGMVRSKYGPFIMTWDGGSVVTFVNTETNELTNFRASGEFFLKILESNTNQDIWYVVSGKEPGNSELNAGIYDHKAKTWIRKVSLPTEARASSIADLRVLPNEHKAYVAIFGGWYQDNMHGYGWLHSVDLVSGGVKVVPIDGGAGCLEASPDSRWLYVGTGWPIPSTSNLLVVDTQSDSIVNQIYLGKNKHNWYYTQMNILQIDPAHPSLLYATSTDGNALVKMDLHSLALLDVLVFNEESFQPQFFVRRPGQANGFILLTNRPYAFELDLDQAIIKRNVRFPNILQNTGTNDIAFNKAGRIFIAQGGSFLEVDAQDMRLLVTHTLPPGAPWVWSFVLSKDEKHLYSVTYNDQIANKFVAMNTTTFQLEASIKLEGGVFNFRPYELPDGSKLYALGGQQNGHVVIHVIETDTYTIKKTITYEEPDRLGISAGPYYPFAYDSNSHTLFVGATHVVLAIDTDTDVIKKVIYLGDAARAIGLGLQQLTYINAIGMVYNPRENYLYIAHLDRSFVSIYNLTNDQFVLKVINLKGFYPRIMYANDDLSKIYSINIRSDNVSVIDVNSKAVETIIDLHSFPITSVRDKEVIPKEFSLSQNFPNPFNPTTTIRYTLPRTREVSLAIYNVLGQLVSRLVVGRKEAGFHEVHWDANVPSGIYFYRLQAGEYLETKKMILLR